MSRRTAVVIAVVIVAALVIGYGAYNLYSTQGFATYDFQVKVTYAGGWQVIYQGYEGGPPRTVASHNNFTGSGDSILTAPVYGNLQKYGLYICAWATKLDDSGGNLTLSLYTNTNSGSGPISVNSTTAPNGTVKVCGGVYP
jgi:hypothetical protein